MKIGKNLLGFIAYLFYMRKPGSQTTQSERNLIAKYAENKSMAVEIGVFEGVNTRIIAKAMHPKGVLYGIDPFFKGKLGVSYSKWVTSTNLWRGNCRDRVVLIEKLSFEASADVPDNIEFLFIDGDHSYEGLKKDWEIWLPKVKPGGIIALHDTYQDKDQESYRLGSYKFFRDVILDHPEVSFVEFVDSLSIVRKKVR